MNSGYVKVATFVPEIKVCDVGFNIESIKKGVEQASQAGVNVLVLPELCITGSTAGDLFLSKSLLDSAKNGFIKIAEDTKNKNMMVFVGLPFEKDGLIYNVIAGVCDGRILGLVAKSVVGKSNLDKAFACCKDDLSYVTLNEEVVPFGRNIVFSDKQNKNLKIGVEFSEEMELPISPSARQVLNGVKLIITPSALPDFSGEEERVQNIIKSNSKRFACAYAFANAGGGESTTDCVYSGRCYVVENGEMIAKAKPFNNSLTVADVDLEYLDFLRAKTPSNFQNTQNRDVYTVDFAIDVSKNKVERTYEKTPFIKNGEEEFLLNAQAEGLKKRILHTYAEKVVVGLSGGLDSTLALIVAVMAMEKAGKSSKDVLAITMPCFGTSSRTFENSIKLAKAFGVPIKKIDITKSVKRHLKDLSHSEDVHDAAYENSQARERTQVLMDMANMVNGLVVGTGDLSELALGWATYNGDHMSMYAVNASIPKTLVRHLVGYVAENSKPKRKALLMDIIDTPVSPELLPPADDKIKQVTEDIVGPYVLHDYFLYSMVKKGFTPKKIYLTAINTFKGIFDEQTILKWLKTFIRRFFTQQFKRSCLPDGVKVTEISLSPRGGWSMPSDALSKVWLEELDNI